MSRNAGKDSPAGPETEQLLSDHVSDNPPSNTRAGLQSEISASQNRFGGLSHNAQPGEIVGTQVTVLPVVANNDEYNDNPPPYSAIPPSYSAIAPPPDYISCRPYGLFSFGDSYTAESSSYRVEILTPFQTSLTTGSHPEETDGQQQHTSYPSAPLTPYRFFKFSGGGGGGSSSVPREISFSDNGIAEKVGDRKTRRYGTFLVAAAVIIFLMALSLMVRFVMEKSWWRR